jgi:hypothetical protein
MSESEFVAGLVVVPHGAAQDHHKVAEAASDGAEAVVGFDQCGAGDVWEYWFGVFAECHDEPPCLCA